MKKTLVIDDKAQKFYMAFEYDLNGVQTHLSQKLIDEYTTNASMMNMLIERMNDLHANSNALGAGRRTDLWEIVFEQCEKMRELVGHTLPKSISGLKKKMAAYKSDGYQAMVNGRLGNHNTIKITKNAAKMLIALKRQRVPVLTDSQIFEAYNVKAEERGLKPLKSIRSLVQWFNNPSVEPLWHDAVYGEMSTHIKYDRRHKTQLPSMRDALWYGDGTKINLFYRDESGKVRLHRYTK